MCQNTTMWVHGAWIKIYYVLCSKHIAPQAMCYDPPLVRDKLLGEPAFVKLLYGMQGKNDVFSPDCMLFHPDTVRC